VLGLFNSCWCNAANAYFQFSFMHCLTMIYGLWKAGTLYLPIYAVVNFFPVWSICLWPFDTLVHLDLEARQWLGIGKQSYKYNTTNYFTVDNLSQIRILSCDLFCKYQEETRKVGNWWSTHHPGKATNGAVFISSLLMQFNYSFLWREIRRGSRVLHTLIFNFFLNTI
jgi:hypothetical protein